MIGGKGLHRGRRHPYQVRVGDTIDSWRVISVKSERRLTLGMGMKSPGAGALEFDVDRDEAQHTRLTATAYWHSTGLWGLVYWYCFYPIHHQLFRGLTREIGRRAGELEGIPPDQASSAPVERRACPVGGELGACRPPGFSSIWRHPTRAVA